MKKTRAEEFVEQIDQVVGVYVEKQFQRYKSAEEEEEKKREQTELIEKLKGTPYNGNMLDPRSTFMRKRE